MLDWHSFNCCFSVSFERTGESKGRADLWTSRLEAKGNFLDLLSCAYFCSAVVSMYLGERPVLIRPFLDFSGMELGGLLNEFLTVLGFLSIIL